MGHFTEPTQNTNIISSAPNNIATGKFGNGNVAFITKTSVFTVPAVNIRVRGWGAGGTPGSGGNPAGGGGGGFFLKTINGLTVGSSISATIASVAAASTSFGAYASATGGANGSGSVGGVGGNGSGGDINSKGGDGSSAGGRGGGCGGVFGDGGNGDRSIGSINGNAGGSYGNGFQSIAGTSNASGYNGSIDSIGTGSTSPIYQDGSNIIANGINGGAGSGTTSLGINGCGDGGFPGGAGRNPGKGLIIVEW